MSESTVEILEKCPVCEGKSQHFYLEVEDFTVSHEQFKLVKCDHCGFVFTNPRPNADSIGRYYQSDEYISHTNSSAGLMNKVYQWARSRSIRSKLKLIDSVNTRMKTLLDYGCGTGEFLAAARNSGWSAVGLEPDEGARQRAESNHALKVDSPSALWTLPDGQFGVITLWHVLEHVHQLNDTLTELVRCLSSDGALIIAVPNCTANEADKYGPFWAAYDVPRHLYHFSKEPTLQLLDKHGLRCEAIQPMFFDPFYISLLSEKYMTGFKNPVTAGIQGVKTTISGRKEIEKNSSLMYIFRKKSQPTP